METINEVIKCSSEGLRGHMNFEEYQQDLIAAIFYKYLSHKIEKENNKKLFKYDINFEEAFNNENIEYYGEKIKNESIQKLGFFIKVENLYHNIINQDDYLEKLDNALAEIIFQDESLNDLFKNVNFKNLELIQETKKMFKEVLTNINSLTFKNEKEDEFNELMKFFMKKSYTPPEISILLSRLLYRENKELENVYDAACGSCSTLLKLGDNHKVINYYGQELNKTTYNMARMNMIMHNILPNNFHIYNDDSTISTRDLPLMDAIISHPPFLKKWEAYDKLLEDVRFNCYKKLPPKSKADYAFIQTMIYHLKEDGLMALAIPQGVLFRTNAEKEIRKTFIINNYIDTIIALPDKTFYKNIPTCIMILRKDRTDEDKILFIDASQNYIKGPSLNKLSNEDINRIVSTYKNHEEIEKYSYKAGIEEIKNNDYNLNIKLYVNTYDEKEKIDINKSIKEIKVLEEKITTLDNKQEDLIKRITNN